MNPHDVALDVITYIGEGCTFANPWVVEKLAGRYALQEVVTYHGQLQCNHIC